MTARDHFGHDTTTDEILLFDGFNDGVHCWGQFLKDYRPTRW